ncbi:hypothetical protein P8C59_000806 [Phyllachora maydis]|uniref:Stress response RCI peptide n=1 Tax=Phyllachora maydis TaxID=1825666 RepID=A0AAD9M865_9PEZI|nr:hypothetical protein P8C59_000806 [Phyllachora maydis]
MCSTDIFLGLLAFIFPPLPVWVKTGICSADSLVNILLCMLGFLPGLVHAWYIIAKFPEPDWDYQAPADAESGRVYVFVPHGNHTQQPLQPHPQPRFQHHQQQGKAAGSARPAANYGTNNAAASPAHPHPQPPPPQQQQQQGHHPHDAGEGSSDMPPPSYSQVVAGDHKIQSQD